MPDPATKAVFLSYASQDVAAALRLCAALRAAGIEVWFDQDALVGGDAWDQKIRGQITACTLFMPVISANTQAREEGYFRLEWKLAEDRSHQMAKGKAFIVPVSIDATSERGAMVPDAFLAVQWTKLPDGETPAAFVARVQKLLAAPRAPAMTPLGAPQSVAVVPTERSTLPLWISVTLGAAVVTLATVVVMRPTSKDAVQDTKPVVESKPGAAPVVAVTDKSIAVLPFTNMSDDQANAHFADGVHEDVLTRLTTLRALRVISGTSMFQYRKREKLAGQIGRELGVAYILEGSVRRAANTVRVTAKLINAATDQPVWANSYDRDLVDIFKVQTQLAIEIAGALHAVLSPAEAASLEARPTKSIAAYDCYQEARVLGRSVANVRDVREKIIPLLERAVVLDPDYAAAWAYLSQQHGSLYRSVDRNEARLAKVKEAVAHAERLAPDSYAVLDAGMNLDALTGNGESRAARRRRIIELFSHRAESHQMMAFDATREARWADAQASFRAALRLDPRNPEVLNNYFNMLDSMRRWDEAEAVAATLLEVQPDNLDIRLLAASMAFRRNGSKGQLTRLLAELPSSTDPQSSSVLVRSRIAMLTGDRPGMLALWREVGSEFKTGDFTLSSTSRFMVAAAFLKLGDRVSARPVLEQIREELLDQLKADPGNLPARTNLCITLGMLEDRTGARTALAEAGELIAARQLKPPVGFIWRLEYALARSWVDEPGAVIAELGRLMREPSARPPWANVHVLRERWATLPLHGDPEFEAMLSDPKNNAPLF